MILIRFLKCLTTILFVGIFFIGAIDCVGYSITPSSGLSFLPGYKKDYFKEELNKVVHYFPRGYNVPDSVMGFDTARNFPPTVFNMVDGSFPIFSNDLGCFDHHMLSEVQSVNSYDYLAGDSFAWGYGNYEKNIGSTYEKKSGVFTVKCGIIHSGQTHQMEKFRRTVKLIGSYPKRVILTFYENDVANDFAYPHTSVIDGYEVDTVRFDPSRFQLIPRDMDKVKKIIEASTGGSASRTWGSYLSSLLKQYSLSWNLILFGVDPLTSNPLKTIYGISEGVSYRKDGGYSTAEVAYKNREALESWIFDSKKNHYELIIVLIPPKLFHAQSVYYEGLRSYLSGKGIRFYDLTYPFWDSRLHSEELYWLNDGHLSNEGNTFVGEYLAKQLSK